MAYRFRFNKLDQASKDQLQQFIYRYFPSNLHEQVFASLEQNGTIPDSLLQEAVKSGTISTGDIPAVQQNIASIASKLPGKGQTYRDYIDSIKDAGAASDEELTQLKEAYQGLGGIKVAKVRFGNREIDTFIDNPRVESDMAKDSGRFKTITQPDYSGNIKGIEDIIAKRDFSRKREGEINDYLTSLPGELQKTRDEYLSGSMDRAKADFDDYVPQAAAELNRRGIMFGGGLDDLLTQKASSLAGGLDELQLKLEEEDNQFYFNAAYQNAIKNELASRDDYRAAIDTERSRIMTDRANRFSSTQSNHDRMLSEELTRSDLSRQFEANKSKLKSDKSARDSANRSKLFQGIGSSAGAIIGASVGGPPGAIAGASIGGSIPGEIG